MSKSKRQRPQIGRCIVVAGNVTAGIVLYRLSFWKPTREINGRLMFAKPRSELEFETGLSAKQVENALTLLRKKELIVTGQHLFHGRNVMHVAVTAACHAALEQAGQSPQSGVPSPPGSGCSVPPDQGTSYTSYKHGVHQGGQQEECELPLTGITGGAKALAEGKDKVKKPRYSSAAEALANAGKLSPKVAGKMHKPDGSKSLELLWVKTVSEATGKYVAPLTMKEIGLLVHIRNKCPKGKAGDVIRHAVDNWITFVKRVEAEAGLKVTPSEPKLTFLLQYVAVAVNMLYPPKTKAKQEAKPVAPKPKPSVQLIADDDEVMTPEELAAILGGEDE